MPKKILITGACGFIGSHVVEHIFKNTDLDIVILDRLDVSGNLNRLTDIEVWEQEKHRVKFLWTDLRATINPFLQKEIGEVDYIIHLAASTHVDRSIDDPMSFVMDNVVGTTNLLDFARTLKDLKLFINFSTDEVFGPADVGHYHKEDESHKPSNPYAASKAGAVDMGYAYFKTFGLPVINTHTMNNFGERQHPEKLIPVCIRAVQNQTEMPIFAELDDKGELQAVGSRVWLHCRETASALLFLLEKGVPGEYYNIIGFEEKTNLDVCEEVAKAVGKPLVKTFVDFHKTRPGHDRRYALDGNKLKDMGWKPEMPFEKSIKMVVDWTIKNDKWM